MSEPLSISCPECSAKLKLKDRSKVGKKIACPKCQHSFLVKAPSDELDELDVIEDELDDFEAEDDEEDAPVSRRGGGSSRGGSAKKPGQKTAAPGEGSNAGLLIALCVGLLLVLGGSGWFVLSMMSKPVPGPMAVAAADAAVEANPAVAVADPRQLDLAYLPATAEMVIVVRPARIVQSPLVKALAGAQLDRMVQQMQAAISLQPADIESVTIGVSGMSDMMRQAGPPSTAALLQSNKNVLMVIRSTKPVEPSQTKPEQNGAKAAEHQGKAYYQIPSSMPAAGTGGLYFASPTLAVLGEESMVKAAIERGPQAASRPELQFVDASQDFVIAAVPRDKTALTSSLPPPGTISAGDAQQLQESLTKSVNGASLGLTVAEGIDLHVALNCADATAANEIQKHLDQFASDGKQEFEKIKGNLPPNLGTLFEQLLTSFKATPDGAAVRLTVGLPASAQNSLQQAPGEIMMAMMTGGFSKGAGGAQANDDEAGYEGEVGAPITSSVKAPDGVELVAHTRWSTSGEQGGSIELPPPLELVIEVNGDAKDRILAFGKVKTIVTTQPEQALTRLRISGLQDIDTLREMQPFQESIFEKRPERLEIVVPYRRPMPRVEALTSVDGSVTLSIAKQVRVEELPRAGTFSGKTVTLPAFKGVALKVLKDENEPLLLLAPGKNYAIGKIEALDGDGKVNPDGVAQYGNWRGVMVHKVRFQEKLPADLGLRITLLSEIEEVEVPFNFQNLQVGKASQSTPEQRQAAVTLPPENVADLPPGLKLSARARWRQMPVWKDQKELPRPMEVVLELSGPDAMRIVASGLQETTAISTNVGDTLKVWRDEFSNEPDPVKTIRNLHRYSFAEQHPVEGVSVVYSFDNPGHPVTELTKFEGGFHVVLAKQTTTAVVDKILTRGGRAISHPAFKMAGLELKEQKDGTNRLLLGIVKGKPANFGPMVVIDSQGNRMKDRYLRQDPYDGIFYVMVPDEARKDAALEFTLNWELEEIDIPFQFAHLPIPPQPEKLPDLTPAAPVGPVAGAPPPPAPVPLVDVVPPAAPVVPPPTPVPLATPPGTVPVAAPTPVPVAQPPK